MSSSVFNETDKMVRTFLPAVLDAAGRTECAQELRDLSPIVGLKDIIRTASRLQALSELVVEEPGIDARWETVVGDALFWCEASIWAVARRDERAFQDHVQRTLASIKEGASILVVN